MPQQTKVEIPDTFDRVAHDPDRILTTLHKIQFILRMMMNRIVEAIFGAVHEIEAILFRKRGYFSYNLVHGNSKGIAVSESDTIKIVQIYIKNPILSKSFPRC